MDYGRDLPIVRRLRRRWGKNYGRIVGGIDEYAVPLMDMFFFLYDQKEEGYVDLDQETEQDLDDMYQQLTDAQNQMLGEHYTRIVLSLNLPEEGEETFAFLDTLHQTAGQYYDRNDLFLVGDSTSDYDPVHLLRTGQCYDQRALGGVCDSGAAVYLPVRGPAGSADPGDPGQHLDQLLLPHPHGHQHFSL